MSDNICATICVSSLRFDLVTELLRSLLFGALSEVRIDIHRSRYLRVPEEVLRGLCIDPVLKEDRRERVSELMCAELRPRSLPKLDHAASE